MLEQLREIVQQVNSAKDLQSALDIIVVRVREVMATQVCSVYLFDKDMNAHVLMASRGLNKEAVGHVSLEIGEGSWGLWPNTRNQSISRMPPASQLPLYSGNRRRKLSLLSRRANHSPPKCFGVVVVQHEQQRRFDEGEEAFLITLSAQLAGVIASAEATGAIAGVSPSGQKISDTVFAGVPGASGVAIGEMVVVFPKANLYQVPIRQARDLNREIGVFNDALNKVRQDMRRHP